MYVEERDNREMRRGTRRLHEKSQRLFTKGGGHRHQFGPGSDLKGGEKKRGKVLPRLRKPARVTEKVRRKSTFANTSEEVRRGKEGGTLWFDEGCPDER